MHDNKIVVCDSEEAWLKERFQGVGGSDAATVMGANKWNSTYSLWALRTGLTTDDSEQSEPAFWGTLMEAPIRDHFRRCYEIEVVEDESFSMRLDPEHDFLRASLDGLIPPNQDMSKLPFEVDSSAWGVYEGKTASQYMTEYWVDGPPSNYYYQVQHYMMVTGAGYAIISTLFGGNHYEVYLVKKDEGVIEIMREAELDFWRRIQEKDSPEVDGHTETTSTLNSIYDPDPENEINFTDEAGQWDDRIQVLKGVIAESTDEKKKLENQLRSELGHATVGYLPSGKHKWTYKASKKRSGEITRTLRRSRA
jgi:putative phage-type endonuclease